MVEITKERKDKQEAKIIKLAKIRQAAIDFRLVQEKYSQNLVNKDLFIAILKAGEALDQAIKESY